MTEYQPGLEGVPATKSSISYLDGKKGILTYRGYRIIDLAENSTYEETAYLLLSHSASSIVVYACQSFLLTGKTG